ncbi:hypothetical protein FACS1894116_04870 [Betaproteobacteria bacterium]|nr:hypothetical protein FACS1894116_04870 [Betaproteobacteria bacterium]GHU28357.1 hypothetical protein FACS189497_03640 [Betaproteobacteria bacterium]
MPNELYILVGATVGGVAAYITAKITTGTQLNIARLNAEKDITLQRDRLMDDRFKNELSTERGKLDILHRILSRIELENSQTMSYIQSDSNLGVEGFRTRYLENCERLHEAMAIADIYYPKMSDWLRQIYGQSNIFWGNQENLLRTDIKTNHQGWQSLLTKVLEAAEAIRTRTCHLKDEIAGRAKELSEHIPS